MSRSAWYEHQDRECATCIFYIPSPKGERGRCFRYPPQGGGFSSVQESEWCGEYKEDPAKIEALRKAEKEQAEKDRLAAIEEFKKTDCCARESAEQNHAPGCRSVTPKTQEK